MIVCISVGSFHTERELYIPHLENCDVHVHHKLQITELPFDLPTKGVTYTCTHAYIYTNIIALRKKTFMAA